MSDEAWQAVKRDHACLIRAARAERFVLDRLCLDDDAPLSSVHIPVMVSADSVRRKSSSPVMVIMRVMARWP